MTKKPRLNDKDLKNAVEAWVIQAIKKKHWPFYASEIGMDLDEDIFRVGTALRELEKEGKVKRLIK